MTDKQLARGFVEGDFDSAEPPSGAPKARYSLSQHRMTRCQSDDDGMCYDAAVCPQLRDGEPARSGRHCPLDKGQDDE